MAATLAEVLRTFGPEYLREHALSTVQARAERVNDFAPPLVMNLVRKAVVISGC